MDGVRIREVEGDGEGGGLGCEKTQSDIIPAARMLIRRGGGYVQIT